MLPRWCLVAAVAFGALPAACGGTPTELVVVVESDLAVPGELDAVDIVVTSAPDRTQTVTAVLTGDGAPALPLTLGIVPRGDDNAEVTVTAVARRSGSEVVRQTTRTRFLPGQTRTLVLRLLRSCVGVRCETGETCDLSGCRTTDLPASSLPRWTGHPPDAGLPPDAGCPPGVDLQGDPLNCGSCGHVCTPPEGGEATCSGGVCGSSCEPGFHPCSDGCQPDDSVSACGPACARCPDVPNASSTCDGISCGFRCDPGFADCDMDAGTGCETDLATASDCGACAQACSDPTPLCGRTGDGIRACVGACAGGETQCGGACVDVATDARHCGGCDQGCPVPENGAAACAMGRCGLACDEGFHACGETCLSDTAPASCGLRCAPCPTPTGATATCRLGECGFLCTTGRGDCNMMAADGCEADLTASLEHCGRCGDACAPPFAMPICSSGVCAIAGCQAGHDDCDGMPDTGCEADLASNEHCGACGNACGAGVTCTMGACGDEPVAPAAGTDHTCVRLMNGQVRCWGANTVGQLGGVPPMGSSVAVVAGLTDAVELAAGEQFTCARRATGAVVCWGRGDLGQLGDGRTGMGVSSMAPVTVMNVPDAVSLAVGRGFACAARADRSVLCWGNDASGQLGDGMAGGARGLPSQVTTITDATSVAAGDAHACAINGSGTVRCWGLGVSGQLGDGMSTDSAAPVAVSMLGSGLAVAGGARHTCAALGSGLRCWGANDFGQLGDGTMTTTSGVPVTVASLSGLARSGDLGGDTSCVVQSSGATFCWGAGDRGQLGVGEVRATQGTPAMVVGLTDATTISCGARHCCAVRSGNVVVCWGANEAGQLGIGMSGDALVPTPVVGLRP